MAHHCHELRHSRVTDAKAINDRWKNERNAPSSNAVEQPNHEERNESWISKESFDLFQIKCLGFHGWGLGGKVLEDQLAFGFSEECRGFGVVREKEPCYDGAKNSWNPFQNKDLDRSA